MRVFYTALIVLLFCFFGGIFRAIGSPYITDYKRSNMDSYKIISKDLAGNRWKIETDWKVRRSKAGSVVHHEYEKMLISARKEAGNLHYNIHFESYERDQEIETKINTAYLVEGRPDHDEIELIDFRTYSISICGMKSALIMLRVGVRQEERAAAIEEGRPAHRYYYDHIFINLEKDGEAVFYPDPLDQSVVNGPILGYFSRWAKKAEYNCQSGYITFE